VARAAGHLFTIGIGLAGWAVVLGLPAVGILPQRAPTTALWITLFIVVILAARALAFRPVEGSVLSLDSAFYVAATLCLGSVAAGQIVAAALTVDAAARLYYTHKRGRADPAGWRAELGYVLYFGGMSGGLVALCGWVWRADALVGRHADAVEVALRVIAIDTLALVGHYALQGVRLRLLGRGWRAYFGEHALPGIAAEASLMPIGVVLVLLYDPDQPLGFLLL
jgi:hypothetical protein